MQALRDLIVNKVGKSIFYGWVIVAIATTAMFASGPGQSHTFSIFNDLIAQELGISNSALSLSYALATLVAAFGLSYLGKFIDKYGARKVLIAVTILLGLACLSFGAVSGIFTLALSFMVLRFLGQGSMMLGATNLIAQWFNAKRGFAMSIVMLGFAATMSIHPLLGQWLIDTVGWREAWMWMGVMTWVMMVPLLILLVHDKPEKLGLFPDGIIPEKNADGDVKSAALQGLRLSAAWRLPAFWIISAGLFTPAMLITSLFFFQVSIFKSHGLTGSLAASMFSVSAISMALFMPAIGWVLDKTNPKYFLSASLLLLALSLVSVTYVYDPVMAVVYAIIFGFNTAANMTMFGFLWARYFGRRHIGTIQGVGQTIGVIGASLGAIPLGIAADLYGSYDGILRILAIMPVICAVLALFLVAPHLPTEEEDEE